MIDARAIELEQRLAGLRACAASLLSMDAYDRWGYPDAEQRAELEREAGEAMRKKSVLEAELEARVAELRASEPEVVHAWCDAHVALLDHYVATIAADARTEKFVAEGERRQWLEVKEGARAFVRENVYYVHHDLALYRSLFGFDPGA